MDIHVVDGFYNSVNLNTIINNSYSYQWTFNRTDGALDYYWTVDIYGKLYYAECIDEKKIYEFKLKEIKVLWDEFSKKFNVPIENLESCYINGLTFGTEAYPHVDFEEKGNVSVIIYLCESWNSYWGGETVFFDKNYIKDDPSNEVFYQHDIIKSVLPKFNRMVLFDGNITHAVRPISKSFKGLRKTLMFKLKDTSIQQIIENYKCN
jgi:hypothetical protein